MSWRRGGSFGVLAKGFAGFGERYLGSLGKALSGWREGSWGVRWEIPD